MATNLDAYSRHCQDICMSVSGFKAELCWLEYFNSVTVVLSVESVIAMKTDLIVLKFSIPGPNSHVIQAVISTCL
jgi:hypothetical protein